MELLLGAGAKVDQAKKDDATPLSCAEQQGHKKCVELLKAAGAKVVH